MKKLTTNQAVFIGLASMLGAGVFVVFGPAAKYAGSLLWLAISLAAIVAYLNAASISQLARVVTRSGGAYAYARHYLGNTWGFIAGAAFLIGKLGSVAAIALTVANYLLPTQASLIASAAIVIMTMINIWGINRTAFGAKVLASITIAFLIVVILASFSAKPSSIEPLQPGGLGVFTAAAIIFFAFAGYARVATLGGEIENPERSIPKAIAISLGIVFAIYLLLGLILPAQLGGALGLSVTPIADLVALAVGDQAAASVSIFAAIAALGSLLALIAGMSRTAATMAQDGELPSYLSRINSKGTPWVAEWLIALIAIILVLVTGVEFAIGLSSFAVLLYYAIANLAAYRQPKVESGRPKYLNLLGLLLCIALLAAVPPTSLLLGFGSLSVLLFLRWGLAKLS